jgi:hypothetical protein
MSRFLFLVLVLLSASQAFSQDLSVVPYAPTTINILNPERGFHHYTEYRPGSSALSASTLQNVKNQGHTLIIRLYTISPFISSDISQAWLNVMTQDFQRIRDAGMKAIVKYRYSTAIGSPDAPLSIVLRHLEQLTPILHDNSDVILTVHAGFIGAWGEWHSSTNNLETTANRRAVLEAVLDAVPVDRQVNIRTPGYKRAIYNRTTPITLEEAYGGSDYARTAHHNDGFLGSSTDLGTYQNIVVEKAYLEADTRYAAMGGETGGVSSGQHYLCANAMREMRRMHWSYINRGWYGPTIDSWIRDGCYDQIQNELGYRFVMDEGRYSESVKPGSAFRFELDFRNEGYAAPFNKRDFRIVLRHSTQPDFVYVAYPPSDPRFWGGGDTLSLAFDIGIPSNMPAGLYEAFIHLPDPYESLRDRPEYAIRFANEDVWEATTGLNRLNHFVDVDPLQDADLYEGDVWFLSGWDATSIDPDSRETPSGLMLHANYPNPFNPSTTIGFQLPVSGHVTLRIVDVLGREVARPVNGTLAAGEHQIRFDASSLASGIYLYTLETSVGTRSAIMTLIK